MLRVKPSMCEDAELSLLLEEAGMQLGSVFSTLTLGGFNGKGNAGSNHRPVTTGPLERIRAAKALGMSQADLDWSLLTTAIPSEALSCPDPSSDPTSIKQFDLNSGGAVFFCLFTLKPGRGSSPTHSSPAEGVVVLKFCSSRLLAQAEQLAAELGRHCGVVTPDSRVMQAAGGSAWEWVKLEQAAGRLEPEAGGELLRREMERVSAALVMGFVHGSKLVDAPRAVFQSVPAAQTTFRDLGRLFLVDCMLGNADRLHCPDLGWRGNPGNILWSSSTSGSPHAGRIVAIDACVQRRPPAAKLDREDEAVDRLAQLVLTDPGEGVVAALLRDQLLSGGPAGALALLADPHTQSSMVAAFQAGMRYSLGRAVALKGLFEMMHARIEEWVAEFIEDVRQAAPDLQLPGQPSPNSAHHPAKVPTSPLEPKHPPHRLPPRPSPPPLSPAPAPASAPAPPATKHHDPHWLPLLVVPSPCPSPLQASPPPATGTTSPSCPLTPDSISPSLMVRTRPNSEERQAPSARPVTSLPPIPGAMAVSCPPSPLPRPPSASPQAGGSAPGKAVAAAASPDVPRKRPAQLEVRLMGRSSAGGALGAGRPPASPFAVESSGGSFGPELSPRRTSCPMLGKGPGMGLTLALKAVGAEAKHNSAISARVERWRDTFRQHGATLKAAADEWQVRHRVQRVLTMGFLSGSQPIVDLYELKVRLDHMLRRMRVLEEAAAACAPVRILDSLPLYLGGAVAADSHHVLRHLGITHLLNSTEEVAAPPASAGFNVLRLPLRDRDNEDITACFTAAADFIDRGLGIACSSPASCSSSLSHSQASPTPHLTPPTPWLLQGGHTSPGPDPPGLLLPPLPPTSNEHSRPAPLRQYASGSPVLPILAPGDGLQRPPLQLQPQPPSPRATPPPGPRPSPGHRRTLSHGQGSGAGRASLGGGGSPPPLQLPPGLGGATGEAATPEAGRPGAGGLGGGRSSAGGGVGGRGSSQAPGPGGVLVHCSEGRSRSVALVVAYLVERRGFSLADALALVRDRRPEACPNAGFSAALIAHERSVRGGVSSVEGPAASGPAAATAQKVLGGKRGKPEAARCTVCGQEVGISAASLRLHMRTKHPAHPMPH